MKVETIEWIGKAEGDIRTSQREFSVNEYPNHSREKRILTSSAKN
jgi:hypothetical protein